MKYIYNKRLLKEVSQIILKNIGYIPTALRVWHTLKNAKMVSVSDYKSHVWEDDIPHLKHKERKDIIGRADWLLKEVIVKDPEQLIKKMPKIIGRQFQGQWAIYACSMTAFALCNIIKLFPDTKDKYLHRLPEVIDLVNTPTIRFYDTMWWKEDAMETLDGNNSHMTYLSILAWMIGQYRMVGGDKRYDMLHLKLCQALNRRMLLSPDLNLPSFPNGVIFFPDMMFSILAMNDYGRIHNGEFDEIVSQWLYKAKNEWIDPKTGLLFSTLFRNRTSGRVSGAYSGLNTTCLCLLDKDFGRHQYSLLKKWLGVSYGGAKHIRYGIMEYLNGSPRLSFDIDAGPIVYGLSPTGIAFSMGAGTYLGDWSFRKGLLATAELGGHTVKSCKTRHYKLAETMLTGEAITLAMRTMVNFDEIYRYNNLSKNDIIAEINSLVSLDADKTVEKILLKSKSYYDDIRTLKDFDYNNCPFMWQMPDTCGCILPGAKKGFAWCLLTYLTVAGTTVTGINALCYHSGPPDGFWMPINEVDKSILIAILRQVKSPD